MNAVLELSGLTATYGEGLVLHGIDLTAKKGRVTCLVGRNGVGKSTTLRAIMGLIKTPSGSIKLDGEDITRLSTDARAHRRADRGADCRTHGHADRDADRRTDGRPGIDGQSRRRRCGAKRLRPSSPFLRPLLSAFGQHS